MLIPYECPCICRYRASHVLLCSKFYSMLRTMSCSTNPVNTIHNDVLSNRAVTFYRNIVESKLEGSFRHCVFVCICNFAWSVLYKVVCPFTQIIVESESEGTDICVLYQNLNIQELWNKLLVSPKWMNKAMRHVYPLNFQWLSI